MKFVFVLLLVCGAVYWWTSSDKKSGTALVAGLFESKEVDPNAPVEITDLNGRTMSCRVVGKRASFVQIERTADQRRFVVDLKTLDLRSRRSLEGLKDFNPNEIDEEHYALAKKTVKAELLYAPELCYFRCPHNGERMLTRDGYNLEYYREFLRNNGISYREVVVKLTKVGNGFMMPPDISALPCVRVGEQLIAQRDSRVIKEALITEYLKR